MPAHAQGNHLPKINHSEIHLPQTCRSVDFISDMHLDARQPHTFEAWKHYMQSTLADAIFILGDLFDVWMGDDILTATSPVGDFERECIAVIADAALKSHIYFMHGNRDLALRPKMLKAVGMDVLHDPTLVHWGPHQVILTHGDLLCINDVQYQKYRKIVHNPIVQRLILMLPLKTRLAMGQKLRQKSMAAQKDNNLMVMDVDDREVTRWMDEMQCNLMIHGHTHRPADHLLPDARKRMVLSDWNYDLPDEKQRRGEILRWSRAGEFQRIALQDHEF